MKWYIQADLKNTPKVHSYHETFSLHKVTVILLSIFVDCKVYISVLIFWPAHAAFTVCVLLQILSIAPIKMPGVESNLIRPLSEVLQDEKVKKSIIFL